MGKKLASLALSAMLLALHLPAATQQPKKVPRIGLLGSGSPSSARVGVDAFRQGLRDLGYVEGQNIAIEYRYAEGKIDRLPELAVELVRLRVDVIVVNATNATLAVKDATRTIPIVMAGAADPVGAGLVASLARPGGNITGLTTISAELSSKQVEILKEAFPNISLVAILLNPAEPGSALSLRQIEVAGQALGVQLQSFEVRAPNDFDRAFSAITKNKAGALIVVRGTLTRVHQTRIVDFAAKTRLPAIYSLSSFVDAGGLMFYGVKGADLDRRAATYVDKILKGAKPADLPVEQPTKFEFVINLKAANQIGLTIPPSVLYRADKVIK